MTTLLTSSHGKNEPIGPGVTESFASKPRADLAGVPYNRAVERRPIQQLSPSLVNRIAAGEVIERPASVVKELVENAIDAGAAQHPGRDRGRRAGADPGDRRRRRHPAGELPLAFAAHATSKLTCDEDLFRIATMGFRGEALASIGSVSHARIAQPAGGAAAGVRGLQPRRGDRRRAGGGGERRDGGRDPEPVFQHARPPEIPQRGRDRIRAHQRDGAAAGAAVPGGRRSSSSTTGGRRSTCPPRPRWTGCWRRGRRSSASSGWRSRRATREILLSRHHRPAGAGPADAAGTSTSTSTAGRSATSSCNHALREAYRGLTEPGRHPAAVLLLTMPPRRRGRERPPDEDGSALPGRRRGSTGWCMSRCGRS